MLVFLSLSKAQVAELIDRETEVIGTDRPAGSAFAMNLPALTEWRNRIWMQIQDALKDVTDKGSTRISSWIESVQESVDAARRELGEQAEQLFKELQRMLLDFTRALQKGLLDLLPSTIATARGEGSLSEISMQYEVSANGTLTASLNMALQIVAGAKLSVSAKYTFA